MKRELIMKQTLWLPALLLFLFILPLVGCFSGKPIQQYTLTIENHEPVLGQNSPPTTILIGPVKLAGYLDQPRLIRRQSETRINAVPNHQWGGNLSEMINSKLVAEIGCLLKPSPVLSYPSQSIFPGGRRVAVDILRFESTVSGTKETNAKIAIVEARWTVFDLANKSIITTQSSRFLLPLLDDSYEALAKTLSHGITQLSQEIAQSITMPNNLN